MRPGDHLTTTSVNGQDLAYFADILKQQPDALSYPMVLRLGSTATPLSGKSSRPPFFAIAAPGVNALGYFRLVQYVSLDQLVYKIQAPRPGLPSCLALNRPYLAPEWEDLGAEYIEAMRTVQYAGPYYIGGMCGGARIAYEMARQLSAAGDEVRFFAIFDTWAVENTRNRQLFALDHYYKRLRNLREFSVDEHLARVRTSFFPRIKRLASRVSGCALEDTRAQSSPWASVYWPPPEWEPAIYPGRITLFKRRRQPFYCIADPLLGWGKRAKGVDVHVVVADKHAKLLCEPAVKELGPLFEKCLRRAQSDELASLSVPQG